jgi:hypothetical protein
MPVEAMLTLGALPGLEPLNRLLGDPMVAALLKVAAEGFGPERPVGVGDPVALAVLLDPGDHLPQSALALDGGGRLPKLPKPPWPLQLDRPCVHATSPGQLPGASLVAGEQVGVPLPPGLVLLLGAAGHPFPLGGTVGLLPRQHAGALGEGEPVAGLGQLPPAQQPPPRTPVQLGQPLLGGLDRHGGVCQPLLSVLALLRGVGDQPAAVGRCLP